MRVSFVVPGFAKKPGGGTRVIYTYASHLASRGHEVTVTHAAFLEPSAYVHKLSYRREWKNVVRALVDLPARPTESPWMDVHPSVTMRYVRSLSPRNLPVADATVATAWRTAEPVARATHGGAGFYFVQHYETWDAPRERVDRTWRLPLRKIVIASWLERIAHELGVGPVRRIPNAIDLGRFRLMKDIGGRPPRVAMLWSSAPVKGGDVGMKAIEVAKRAVPTLEARLFGVGAPPSKLPEYVTYYRNPPQHVLVNEIYNGSSIYLCPSWSEGWHLPPAEAMACGCAVVSTDIDGVSDYAIEGATARLVEAGDVQGLGNAIIELLQQPDERSRLARSGTEKVREYDWIRSADLFERALADGLAGDW